MKTKLVHEVRAIKTRRELGNIVKAQRISERVLKLALTKLRDGITELQIANFIKKTYVKMGAPVLAFNPIVSFGKNTANIHHQPGKATLKKGDIVMFDFGTTVNHYCSDMTRTYFWGEPSAKQKKVYLSVLEAQNRALKKVLAGEKKAAVIDKSARNYLAKKFKNNFKHGLGHGVGTVIHEWPNFKLGSSDILPAGVVMTVEPGIYLKKFGGVRIEDMVLVGKKGCRNLTKMPKSLDWAIIP